MTYFGLGQTAAAQYLSEDIPAYKLTMQKRQHDIREEVQDCLASHGSRPADELEKALHAAFKNGWDYYVTYVNLIVVS